MRALNVLSCSRYQVQLRGIRHLSADRDFETIYLLPSTLVVQVESCVRTCELNDHQLRYVAHLFHLDDVYVMFEGQGMGSKFVVRGRKMC